MNSRRTSTSFMNPILLWSRLAWKTGEMAIASVPVIGHRSSRLLLAGVAPSARDRREFELMVHEKSVALWESAQAMSLRLLVLNQQWAALAFRQMLSTSATLMSIATSRSLAESVLRQSKLAHDAVTGSVVAASRLSGFAALLTRRGLVPVHARIRGNVRRLGRISK